MLDWSRGRGIKKPLALSVRVCQGLIPPLDIIILD